MEKNKFNIDSLKKTHNNSYETINQYQKQSKVLKAKGMFLLRKLNSKIGLISNDNKRMQSIESMETYAYGTSKLLVNEKE